MWGILIQTCLLYTSDAADEGLTKSDIVFSNDYTFAIDTIITESYSKPDPFESVLIRTPFAMTLGNSKLRIILSYLNYSFDPKNVSDPIFGSNAYFFGADFNLDNIFTFGGDNLNKSYDFQWYKLNRHSISDSNPRR